SSLFYHKARFRTTVVIRQKVIGLYVCRVNRSLRDANSRETAHLSGERLAARCKQPRDSASVG
ncbi:MAG: hypothetical protein WAZ11_08835, partial [Trichococcus flocculiformis]